MEYFKDVSRGNRLQQVARLKVARKFYYGYGRVDSGGFQEMDARRLGMVAHTPQSCSCMGCGNSRRWLGERTIQEQRHSQVSVHVLLADSE